MRLIKILLATLGLVLSLSAFASEDPKCNQDNNCIGDLVAGAFNRLLHDNTGRITGFNKAGLPLIEYYQCPRCKPTVIDGATNFINLNHPRGLPCAITKDLPTYCACDVVVWGLDESRYVIIGKRSGDAKVDYMLESEFNEFKTGKKGTWEVYWASPSELSTPAWVQSMYKKVDQVNSCYSINAKDTVQSAGVSDQLDGAVAESADISSAGGAGL